MSKRFRKFRVLSQGALIAFLLSGMSCAPFPGDSNPNDPDASSGIPAANVEVTVVGGGVVRQTFEGSLVMLAAEPVEGWQFESWSGTVHSRQNPIMLLYSDESSIVARFISVDVSDQPDDCPDDPLKVVPGVCGCGVADVDSDGDGIEDCVDNCPLVTNASQANDDADTSGNECDPDDDDDGVLDAEDLCPRTVSATVDATGCPIIPTANDTDGDGVANDVDLCPGTTQRGTVDEDGCTEVQLDEDGDGILDTEDNCAADANAQQEDQDADGLGDACDDDVDGDLVQNSADQCPSTALGDAVDLSGCSDVQVDNDLDGYCNQADTSAGPSGCSGVDNCPNVANQDQADVDDDGKGDECDDALCGNGLVEPGESCDPPCNECDADCQLQSPQTDVVWSEGVGIEADTGRDPDGALLGVWGTGPDDIFFVGGTDTQGEAFHFDGTSWVEMTVGDVPQLIWVFGFGPADVYAVGRSGTLIHYDGTAWDEIETPFEKTLWGVWGSGPDDLWVVGGDVDEGLPIVARYDGMGFTTYDVEQTAGANALYKVWGIGSRVFAVGQKGLIAEFAQGQWRQVPSGAGGSFFSLWGTSENNIVAVGGTVTSFAQVAVFDGNSWHTNDVDYSVQALSGVYMTHPDVAIIGGLNGYKGNYGLTEGVLVQEDFFSYPPIHALWSDCEGSFYAVGGYSHSGGIDGFYLVRSAP